MADREGVKVKEKRRSCGASPLGMSGRGFFDSTYHLSCPCDFRGDGASEIIGSSWHYESASNTHNTSIVPKMSMYIAFHMVPPLCVLHVLYFNNSLALQMHELSGEQLIVGSLGVDHIYSSR